MKKVAITGSYAVGKSYIMGILEDMGYPVFNSDKCVDSLYKDISIQKKIIDEIDGFDKFDKKHLASLIYSEENLRKKVEAIVHPLVIEASKNFAEENKDKDIVFTEIPLLFEAGLANEFDISICVYCDEETRIKRASARKFFSKENYDKLNNIQLPQDVKRKYADYVLNSDQDDVVLRKNINVLIEKIVNG